MGHQPLHSQTCAITVSLEGQFEEIPNGGLSDSYGFSTVTRGTVVASDGVNLQEGGASLGQTVGSARMFTMLTHLPAVHSAMITSHTVSLMIISYDV